MSTLTVTVDDTTARELRRRLDRFQNIAGYFPDIYEKMTAIGESQTRRRIESEKESPDGAPWAPWSRSYAATRHAGHSLLISEGNLLDSIHAFVERDFAGWGTNVNYAADHQFGLPQRHVPARPFLGISETNFSELADILEEWAWRDVIGG